MQQSGFIKILLEMRRSIPNNLFIQITAHPIILNFLCLEYKVLHLPINLISSSEAPSVLLVSSCSSLVFVRCWAKCLFFFFTFSPLQVFRVAHRLFSSWGTRGLFKLWSMSSRLEKWNQSVSPSTIWFFVTPWIAAHQAPLSRGFFRQEYWKGLPFLSPGDLPDSGIEPSSPTL